MKKTLILAAVLACSGVVAQEQSFICKGEQITQVEYNVESIDSAKILPATAAPNNDTWVFNEDGLSLLGSTSPTFPMRFCEYNDDGRPVCKGGVSTSFLIFENNIFELNLTTVKKDRTELMITRSVVVGRCSKI